MPETEPPENVIQMPKRGRGRPRKYPLPETDQRPVEKAHKPKKSLLKRVSSSEDRVLSEEEAENLFGPLCQAIKDDAKYLDEALWWYAKDADQPQIWSDMDREEIETLARMMIKRGQRNVASANFVRNVTDSSDYINTAIIVVPRMIKSVQEATKRPKVQRARR